LLLKYIPLKKQKRVMTTKMKSHILVSLIISAIAIVTTSFHGCSTTSTQESQHEPTPINLSVFLDLSDRLDSDKPGNSNLSVSQMHRDIAIVEHLVDLFIDTCMSHTISASQNHFQVLFHPTPNTSDIATIAANLNVDMSKITNPGDKKKRLMSMKDEFSKSLSLIYNQTLKDKQWPGSDIWGFFCNKNPKVDDLCIRNGYRNVLVILTDGYIYHESNAQKKGKSYSYLLPTLVDNVSELSLMASRNGLENLEVLMLEINPGKSNRQTKLITILEDWLKNMGVEHYTVTETDLPSNTQTIIDNFFK